MTLSEELLAYWPIFVTLAGGVISLITIWIKTTARITDIKGDMTELERNVAKLEGRVDTMQPDLGTIKTDIAVMKNTLEFIKGALAQSTGITNNIK